MLATYVHLLVNSEHKLWDISTGFKAILSNPISSNKKCKCPISSNFLLLLFLDSESKSEWLMYNLTKMTPSY